MTNHFKEKSLVKVKSMGFLRMHLKPVRVQRAHSRGTTLEPGH